VGTTVTDLGTLGGIASKALGINENGQIVGWSLDAEANKLAFVWSPESGMTALPFPAPGATLVEAISINNWGLAIGTASVPREVAPSVFRQQTRGYLWSPDGGVIDLGDLNPATDDAILITPAAINDFGLVVGTISGQSTTTPFLWQSGVMRNLNSLVDPAAGWRIVSAKDINNSGQIAASGVHTDGRHRALVLTPIPPGCPADFNDSGTVTVEDLFEFLAAYFESDSRADVNASGAVTVQDIFDYLLVYFAGCP
jgi:probable HAF family extracellular repeat protein